MAQFLLSQEALERQAQLLSHIAQESGASMLVALKACSCSAALELLHPYAAGCCASGIYEARQGRDHLGGEVAVYSPAYREEEFDELLEFATHLDFNSLPQWRRFQARALAHPRVQSGELLLGWRINPCFSTGHTALYDPCAVGSRLGIPASELASYSAAEREDLLRGISGLHFHCLCEQGAQELIDTFTAFEKDWGDLLQSPAIRYLNLGGGHWITKPDYDRSALVDFLQDIRKRYSTSERALELYLEPGEAWFIHTGVLRAQVLDVFESLGVSHAILDVSASAHMPDVLEMPYRPDVYLVEQGDSLCEGPAVCLAGERYLPALDPAETATPSGLTYKLGAPTCLAGDVIGDYYFPRPLQVGDTILLDDMTHYSMVKTTHFNGGPHPDIALLERDGCFRCLKHFGYSDFKERLG